MKKFLLENNLSKVGKWLRFLGYDVKVLSKSVNLRDILNDSDRIFVTTSKKWEERLRKLGIKCILVPRHGWKEQMCAIIKALKLNPKLSLDLCAMCGAKLKFVDKDSIKDRLPPKVYEKAYDFAVCPSCGYIFWKGIHYERMKRMFEDLIRELSQGRC